jgi:glutathione peroxidase
MEAIMKKVLAIASAIRAIATQRPGVAAEGEQSGNAFQFQFTAIDGGAMPLDQFRGKALLVVNTASYCGYTPQYEGLQKLWEKYGEQGLVVIGVPSNDFGEQEPGDETKIEAFCSGQFGITFPLTQKYAVKGKNAHPFYQWAARAAGNAPGWNFYKYLVSRDGRLAAWFPTSTAPGAKLVTDRIEAELAKPK